MEKAPPKLRKFVNDPAHFADDALDGLVLAHAKQVRRVAGERRAIVRREAATPSRVTIATGGGSGHLPLFVGYVVQGLADGCAVGNMFASPSAEVMLAVTKEIDAGHGVLYLYGNYGGDKMNFDAAAEFALEQGIVVETVRAADDILSAPGGRADGRWRRAMPVRHALLNRRPPSRTCSAPRQKALPRVPPRPRGWSLRLAGRAGLANGLKAAPTPARPP